MAIKTLKGRAPYTEWIDLKGDGILSECLVLKRDDQGSIYYIEIPKLDAIDKQRLGRILANRNAGLLPCYDLLNQITLQNGMNALNYFHQMVKCISADGVPFNMSQGVMGTGIVDTNEQVVVRPSATEGESAQKHPKAKNKLQIE